MTNIQSSVAVNLSLPDTHHHIMKSQSESTQASSKAEEMDSSESSESELFVKTIPRHHQSICYSCNSNWPVVVVSGSPMHLSL